MLVYSKIVVYLQCSQMVVVHSVGASVNALFSTNRAFFMPRCYGHTWLDASYTKLYVYAIGGYFNPRFTFSSELELSVSNGCGSRLFLSHCSQIVSYDKQFNSALCS